MKCKRYKNSIHTTTWNRRNTSKRILKEIGFENVYVVKEQEEPDGNFPTVDYPNPEDGKAFKLSLELAKKLMQI